MNGFCRVIHCKEKENARQQIKPQGMHITNAMPGEKFVRQLPRTNKKEAEGSKKFGVPVKKLIEKIDNDIPERAAVIDGRLSALVRSTARRNSRNALTPKAFGAAFFAGRRSVFELAKVVQVSTPRYRLR